ncbi:MAG: helix-turn-helix domain-containing protein [Lachnospiraceae bacterium]|nr:helix-turn-helix domain-containing protein [Lachnospiraceae bacterium]
MIDMNKIGRAIKSARVSKNMTQLGLADLIGVSYQAVSNWERGQSMPDIAKIPEIARVLDLNVADLLGDGTAGTAVQKITEAPEVPLTKEEIQEIAPILPPQELKMEMEKTAAGETLDFRALTPLAPYLDDEYLDAFVESVDAAQIGELIELAPFLSDNALRIAFEKVTDPCDIEDLVALAPFLPDDVLDDYAEKLDVSDLAKLVELAPFLSDDVMMKIFERLSGPCDIDTLVSLAPFVPDEALDRFAENMDVSDFGKLEDLAPFLSDEAFDRITDRALQAGNVSDLEDLAPFLSDKSIRKIAEFLLRQKDGKALGAFAEFL